MNLSQLVDSIDGDQKDEETGAELLSKGYDDQEAAALDPKT